MLAQPPSRPLLPSLPTDGGAAKSSCSLQKTDSVDGFLFLILISPFSLSLLCLSLHTHHPLFLPWCQCPLSLLFSSLQSPQPYLSLFPAATPVSTPLRSPFQFIRIIPSDRKRSPSLSVPQSVRPSGGRREGGKGLVKFVKFAGSRAAAAGCQPTDRRRTRPRPQCEGTERASELERGSIRIGSLAPAAESVPPPPRVLDLL